MAMSTPRTTKRHEGLMNSKGSRTKRQWGSLRRQLETCLEVLGKTMKTLRITSVKTKIRNRYFLDTPLQTEPICSVSGKVQMCSTRMNAET
jgi:hypothetical protein